MAFSLASAVALSHKVFLVKKVGRCTEIKSVKEAPFRYLLHVL
jgi:hypothetical protein